MTCRLEPTSLSRELKKKTVCYKTRNIIYWCQSLLSSNPCLTSSGTQNKCWKRFRTRILNVCGVKACYNSLTPSMVVGDVRNELPMLSIPKPLFGAGPLQSISAVQREKCSGHARLPTPKIQTLLLF